MRAVSTLALGVALVSMAAPAEAQTVISRTISDQPVETTVMQGPAGTVVSRRVLATDNVWRPGYVVDEVAAPPAAPVVAAGAPVVAADETVDTVRTTPVVRHTRTVTRHVSSRTRRATRTVRRSVRRTTTVRPLTMTPAERDVVYRTIRRERVIPAPATREVVTTYGAAYAPAYRPLPYWGAPVVAADESYYGYDYPAPVTTSVVYHVGSVLPESVPLYGIPQSVVYRVPALRPYSYAYVGERVYVVDPATGTIVADVTE